jgi:hypothetical protein
MGLDVRSGNHAGEASGREAGDLTQRVCGARAVRQRRVDAAAERDESVDAPASSVHLALYPGLERFVAQRQTLCPDVSPGSPKIGQEREPVFINEHAEPPPPVGAERPVSDASHALDSIAPYGPFPGPRSTARICRDPRALLADAG